MWLARGIRRHLTMSHHMSHNSSFQLFPTTELHMLSIMKVPYKMLYLKPKALVLPQWILTANHERRTFQVTQGCNSPSEQARSRSGWLIYVLGSGYLRLLQAASGAHKVGQTEKHHCYKKASTSLDSHISSALPSKF